jgi:putative ABC transport system ATP-binding protein
MSEAMAETPLITFSEVSKVYKLPAGDVIALDHISLKIMKGEFVAIMGPSGSGKSTTMNMIGCLDTPTSGDLMINGINTKDMNDRALTSLRRDTIGFIFQQFNLIPSLTILENVEFPLLMKYGGNIPQGRAEHALATAGLDPKLYTHTPAELSGGQQQRAAIARSLVNDPVLLLCDEPTGNLDRKTGIGIMKQLADMNSEGTTVIMVTHDPTTAEYADRTIMIEDGRIV